MPIEATSPIVKTIDKGRTPPYINGRALRRARTFPGPLAQLGERLHGMEEVDGSIPLRSTKSKKPESRNAVRFFVLRRDCFNKNICYHMEEVQ